MEKVGWASQGNIWRRKASQVRGEPLHMMKVCGEKRFASFFLKTWKKGEETADEKEQIAVWKVGVWERRSETLAGGPPSPSLPLFSSMQPQSSAGQPQGSAASLLHSSCALC